MLTRFSLLALLTTVVSAGYLQDKTFSFIPAACQNDCAVWSNTTTHCIENINSLSVSIVPGTGAVELSDVGNKLVLYLCLCNDNTVQSSSSCLTCMSNLNCIVPSLTPADYTGVCANGTNAVEIAGKVMHSSCPK